jgi:hypothetical protein
MWGGSTDLLLFYARRETHSYRFDTLVRTDSFTCTYRDLLQIKLKKIRDGSGILSSPANEFVIHRIDPKVHSFLATNYYFILESSPKLRSVIIMVCYYRLLTRFRKIPRPSKHTNKCTIAGYCVVVDSCDYYFTRWFCDAVRVRSSNR